MTEANNAADGGNSNENQTMTNNINCTFCWICHRYGAHVNCFTCIRKFHADCITTHLVQSYQCEQCILIKYARQSCEMPKELLNRSLQLLHQRLLKDHFVLLGGQRLMSDDEYNELNQTPNKIPMNLSLVEAKIGTYETGAEFLDDILWIQHYCLVVDPSAGKKNITTELVAYCKNEINKMEWCDECYQNASENPKWFTIACAKRHPVVWAKVLGKPYQPAKVMHIQRNSIAILFFGDHKVARIPSKFCLGFSQKSPNKHLKTCASIMEEVNEYIHNLGTFEYANFGEKFNPVGGKRTEPKSNPVEPVECEPSNVRKMINELLDKHDETVNESFRLKEEIYLKRIEELEDQKVELENKVEGQRRKYEEEIHEIKKRKWCIECTMETTSSVNIFCSNSCGGKWYQNSIG